MIVYLNIYEFLRIETFSYTILDKEEIKSFIANERKKDPNLKFALHINPDFQSPALLINLSSIILEIQKNYNITISKIFAP